MTIVKKGMNIFKNIATGFLDENPDKQITTFLYESIACLREKSKQLNKSKWIFYCNSTNT